jgi:DNA-binding MarR family transcriptional regulator
MIPAMSERLVSRRGDRRYAPERLLPPGGRVEAPDVPPRMQQLMNAGRLSSAFRRELRGRELDLRLARLLVCFSPGYPLRPRDIAWLLGVARSTASGLLDDAEREGLVDKFYWPVDRRGTWAQLTKRGRSALAHVEAALSAAEPDEPRFGWAYGRRATPPWDP